jgi:hypothetical protein
MSTSPRENAGSAAYQLEEMTAGLRAAFVLR